MKLREIIRKVYHLFIKRDVVSIFTKRKFGSIGKDVMIFKPVDLCKNTKLITIGNGTVIGGGVRMNLYPHLVENKPHIIIGSKCYIGSNNSFLAGGDIRIGDNVLMASNILISSENHGIDPEDSIEYMDQPLIARDVAIGDGCWIGEKVCILPGVHIGTKSIIGAGSVVTKSVPAYSIAVGNPAKIIKQYDFKEHKWVKVDSI